MVAPRRPTWSRWRSPRACPPRSSASTPPSPGPGRVAATSGARPRPRAGRGRGEPRVSVPTALDRLIIGAPALAAARRALADGQARGVRCRWPGPAWPFALAALARDERRAPCWWSRPATTRRATWLAGAHRPDGPRRRGAVAHPRRRRPARAVGPSPHLVGLRARARATLGRPATVVVASAPALAERVPAPAQARSPSRWPSATGCRWTSSSTAWSRWGTSASPRWRSAATCRCAAASSTCTPPPPTCPRASSCSATRSRACARSRRSPSAPSVPSSRLVAWPAAEPRGRRPIDPAAPSRRSARPLLVRLAPAEHAAGPARGARAAGGRGRRRRALVGPTRCEAELAALSALDLSPPAGAARGAFDAVEARFATRSRVRGRGRAAAPGPRRACAWSSPSRRRGDMSRALARMERLRPVELAPGEHPAAGHDRGMRSLAPCAPGSSPASSGIAVVPEERILRRRRPSAQRGPVVGRRLASFLDLQGRRPRRARGPRHRPPHRLRDPHRRRADPRLPGAGVRRRRPPLRARTTSSTA